MKFPLGQIVGTPGALEAIAQAGQTPAFFLDKHGSGDWGEVCDEDKRLNDQALVDGSRLLSAYRTLKGVSHLDHHRGGSLFDLRTQAGGILKPRLMSVKRSRNNQHNDRCEMGLTIHYGLKSTTRKPLALVERMRQLALDLPFEKVDDQVQHLGPEVCQRPLDELRPDEKLFSAVLDGCQHAPIPWHRKQSASVTVQPLEIFSFWTIPGPGSEWASFGLARYPAEIEVTYRPLDDDRFIKTIKKGGSTRWQFDWQRWERWLVSNGHTRWEFPEDEKFPAETEDQDPAVRLALFVLLQDAILFWAFGGWDS